MLQKIIFQDNIFQINRSLDLIEDGLKLELSEELFDKKFINDILFFDFVIQNIYDKIVPQAHLPAYLDTMHCLYFCIKKYINIFSAIMDKKKDFPLFENNSDKFMEIVQKYQDILNEIGDKIKATDTQEDAVHIVSQNELSELLNFG